MFKIQRFSNSAALVELRDDPVDARTVRARDILDRAFRKKVTSFRSLGRRRLRGGSLRQGGAALCFMPSEEQLLDSLGVTSMVGELAGMTGTSAGTSLPRRTLRCWLGVAGNGRFRFDTLDSSLVIDRDAPQNIRHLSRFIPGCTRRLAEARRRFFELRCASLRADRKSNQSQNLESPW
jgi:hypothetical protein